MSNLLLGFFAFLLSPRLYVIISRWGKKLEFVSQKRLTYLMLTAEISMFWDKHKQRLKNTQLAALIFEVDNFIDKGSEDTIRASEILSLGKFRTLVEDIVWDLKDTDKSIIEGNLSKLIHADESAKKAKTVEEYLINGRISIGLPILAQMYALLASEQLNQRVVNIAGEIIRIQSDLATVEKDKYEANGNNIAYLSTTKEVEQILSEKLLEFYKIKKITKTDRFLETLIGITSKLYKPKKDFEF